MNIVENMPWPPNDFMRYKMREHSTWYAGDPDLLADFYENLKADNPMGLTYLVSGERFWARQIHNKSSLAIHVPIAGDIAETSADLLFGESPIITIVESKQEKASQNSKDAQDTLATMLLMSGFYAKLIEAAEASAAIGGVYIKLAWDRELSEYPLPVLEQADDAYPEFIFGILKKVDFVSVTNRAATKITRLVETYRNDGSIETRMFEGTETSLGQQLSEGHPSMEGVIPMVETGIPVIFCNYIPNILPNRFNRNSYQGRSDYQGQETLMDSLDQTYSSWMRDIALAQGRILVPQAYLEKSTNTGNYRFNVDEMIFTQLDYDPTVEGAKITPNQFAIRANEFEKTSLNLIERIVTSSGYSPQSFGLNIQGRAESGTALNIRERKSFFTKAKKERYWYPAIMSLVNKMMLLYSSSELGGKIDPNLEISVAFGDSIVNSTNELSESVKKISEAVAASTYTKVKMLHPEWSEDEITSEVKKINDENGLSPLSNPDNKFDISM